MSAVKSAHKRVNKVEAYGVLLDEILSGHLEPGRPISERELVNRFGISRTPIRQVLWQLERDDLVVLHPNRGAFVKKMGTDEILELFQLREALEPLACALAATRRPESELVELQATFRDTENDLSTPASDLIKLGESLHDAVIQWSGNRMLLRIYETLRVQTHLMRNLLHALHGSECDSFHEHVAILVAIERQDAEGSRQAMEQHLHRSRMAILDNLFGGPANFGIGGPDRSDIS